MNFLRKLIQTLMVLLVLAAPAVSVAQAPNKKDAKAEEKVEPSYVMSYLALIMCVALGLTAICMPSHRKSEVEVHEE